MSEEMELTRKSEQENPEEFEEVERNPFVVLAESPEIRKALADAISEIPKLVRRNMEVKAKWMTLPTMILILLLVCAIVGTITYLAAIDKVSSDAITFLFGTIVGASFTFLQKFLPK